MKYLAVKIKTFLRFEVISAVLFCIPNVTFISDIDISKPLASKKSLNLAKRIAHFYTPRKGDALFQSQCYKNPNDWFFGKVLIIK